MAYGVWRMAYGVWRMAYGVWPVSCQNLNFLLIVITSSITSITALKLKKFASITSILINFINLVPKKNLIDINLKRIPPHTEDVFFSVLQCGAFLRL